MRNDHLSRHAGMFRDIIQRSEQHVSLLLSDEPVNRSNHERDAGVIAVIESSPKSVVEIMKSMEATLREQGIATARLDAEVLLCHYLNRDRVELYQNGDFVPSDKELLRINQGLARRIEGEPVAYIIGRKEFWSLEFEVNRSVLIPRPETEFVVETMVALAAQSPLPRLKILEIGTGSGAISIALASELKNGRVFAIDISRDALTIARKNAQRHGVESRVFFFCGNLCDPVKDVFDFVISNPPYISARDYDGLSSEVRNFEPKEALLAGCEGTEFHRYIINGTDACIKKGGWLIMEIGYGQREAVERMLRQNGKYDYMSTHRDYAGIERVVLAQRKE